MVNAQEPLDMYTTTGCRLPEDDRLQTKIMEAGGLENAMANGLFLARREKLHENWRLQQ